MSDTLFMCIPAAHESPGKSFDELRMEDYLQFYTTTGRAPPPCPQEPTADAQRAGLGLPPLFKPYPPPVLGPDSKDLPDSHAWTVTSQEGGEKFQTMAGMADFKLWSFEELRCHAYAKGHRLPPLPVALSPFVPSPVPSNPLATSGPRVGSFTGGGTSEDQMLTISTQAAYADHSLEELRVAYLQAGRELTSAEIIARALRPPGIAPSISTTTTSPFAPRPPAVRLF